MFAVSVPICAKLMIWSENISLTLLHHMISACDSVENVSESFKFHTISNNSRNRTGTDGQSSSRRESRESSSNQWYFSTKLSFGVRSELFTVAWSLYMYACLHIDFGRAECLHIDLEAIWENLKIFDKIHKNSKGKSSRNAKIVKIFACGALKRKKVEFVIIFWRFPKNVYIHRKPKKSHWCKDLWNKSKSSDLILHWLSSFPL